MRTSRALLHRALTLASVLAVVLAGCVSPSEGADEDLRDAERPAGGANAATDGDDEDPGGDAPPEDPPADDGNDAPSDAPPPASAPVRTAPVVIAFIDTGINPYHTEFRDPSPLAALHPSTYLPGYPEDAQPLHLSLDAPDLATALERDAAVWEGVKAGVLYYVPGTRVVGLASFAQDGAHRGFDSNGHGTMSASRAAGATTGLAPAARIVALEGLSSDAVAWAGAQSWIDVQSNSWVTLAPNAFTHEKFRTAAEKQPVFAAAGNGLAQILGGVGHPAFLHSTQGPPGVIAVGGHDNAEVTFWSGTMPHVAADACDNWAADARSMDRTGPRVGSGTSSAAPYAAGAAAALIEEARRVLGDATGGRDGTVLARAAPGATPPESGPLADGDLTLDELKAVLFRTADPRPQATPHDGERCGVETTPYNTAPVRFDALPEDVPPYYFVGYGVVNAHTLAAAKSALRGEVPLPERPEAERFHELDDALRALTPT